MLTVGTEGERRIKLKNIEQNCFMTFVIATVKCMQEMKWQASAIWHLKKVFCYSGGLFFKQSKNSPFFDVDILLLKLLSNLFTS